MALHEHIEGAIHHDFSDVVLRHQLFQRTEPDGLVDGVPDQRCAVDIGGQCIQLCDDPFHRLLHFGAQLFG